MFHNALHDYLWDKQQAHECDILVFAFNATVVCALSQKLFSSSVSCQAVKFDFMKAIYGLQITIIMNCWLFCRFFSHQEIFDKWVEWRGFWIRKNQNFTHEINKNLKVLLRIVKTEKTWKCHLS